MSRKRDRARRETRILAAACFAVAMAAPVYAVAQSADGAVLLRVFLRDGTAVSSYGEYARVGDRLVFSMPLGSTAGGVPRLHLVNLPLAAVDLEATERYAAAARAARYAATRGEADYARLSEAVAAALSDIAVMDDVRLQIERMEQIRHQLGAWPGQHHGYRDADIRQIVLMIDDILAGLRAQIGESRFDLRLVSGTASPPPVPLLGAPTLQETILHALRLAEVSDAPADRISLFRSAIALIDERPGELPDVWRDATRATAESALSGEIVIEREYGALSSAVHDRARRMAGRADVRGLQETMAWLVDRDVALGRRRPELVLSLIDLVRNRLDAARRLRLARDQWALKVTARREYRRAVDPVLRALGRARPALDDIRLLAGPEVGTLPSLEQRLIRARGRLDGVVRPADLDGVHANLGAVLGLAERAVSLRRYAVQTADIAVARDASAAAAGALLLLERVTTELTQALEEPGLP